MRTLRFFFDFISPYAYLGWKQVDGVAERHRLAVEPVPVVFGAMLKTYGHKGPAEIPPKRVYAWKQVLRLAAGLGVTIAPPPAHPFNPLLALRVASTDLSPETRRRVVDRLFAETWEGGAGVTDPETVATCLDDLGLPGRALVAEAESETVKARLRAATDAAIEAGVFGVPSFVVGDEVFWGQDSLPHLEDWLEGRDPVDPKELARWLDLPMGVSRV